MMRGRPSTRRTNERHSDDGTTKFRSGKGKERLRNRSYDDELKAEILSNVGGEASKKSQLEDTQIRADVLCCVNEGRCAELRALLEDNSGLNLDVESEDGLSLLMLADIPLVKVLLEYGADPSYLTQVYGDTILTHVIKSRDPDYIREVVELVVRYSEEAINVPDKGGFTPVQLLLLKGYTPLLDCFIELGANMAIPNTLSGESTVHQAIRRGQHHTVHTLIQQKLYLTPLKKTGETPVHTGAWCKQTFLTFQLLKAGANCRVRSKSGSTALHWAAERGDKHMIVLLLVAGGDPLQRDHFGMNSVMVAEKRCGEDVSSVFNLYARRLTQPLSLQYLARKTYLWRCNTRGSPSNTHGSHSDTRGSPSNVRCCDDTCTNVFCDGVACTLPAPIQDYINATDYQLLVGNMM